MKREARALTLSLTVALCSTFSLGCYGRSSKLYTYTTDPEVWEIRRSVDPRPSLRLVASLGRKGLKVGVRLASRRCVNVQKERRIEITEVRTGTDPVALAVNFVASSLLLGGGITLLALAPGFDDTAEKYINDQGEEKEHISDQSWGYVGGVVFALGGLAYTIANISVAAEKKAVKVKKRRYRKQEKVLGPVKCSNNSPVTGHELVLEIGDRNVSIPGAALAGRGTLWIKPGKAREIVEAAMDNPAPASLAVSVTLPVAGGEVRETALLDPRRVRFLLDESQRQELQRRAEAEAERRRQEAARMATEERKREEAGADLRALTRQCSALQRRLKVLGAQMKQAGDRGEVEKITALDLKKKQTRSELGGQQDKLGALRASAGGLADGDENLKRLFAKASSACR